MSILNIKDLDNIIYDYKNQLETFEKYEKCLDEIKQMDYEIYIDEDEDLISSQLLKPNKEESEYTLCILDIHSSNVSFQSSYIKTYIIGDKYCRKDKIFLNMILHAIYDDIGNCSEIKCIRGQSQI